MAVLLDARRSLSISPLGRAGVRAAAGRLPTWFVPDVLAPFCLTRAMLAAVAIVASALAPPPDPAAMPPAALSMPWISIWSTWDSGWYLSIARDGYSYVPGEQSNVAFAPGLPLLMHLGAAVFGDGNTVAYVVVGTLLTNFALLVALAYLVALVRLDFEPETARRSALYLLVFPSSFFLSIVYPHSLFLACAIASFYYARRGRWWLAGALGCGAGLMRLQGAAIALPLAYEYLAQRRFNLKRSVSWSALSLGLVPLGALAFSAYLYATLGDPLAPLKAEEGWHRHLTPPWELLQAFVAHPLENLGWLGTSMDFFYTLLLLALVALTWRRLRTSLALFATIFVLVFISSGTVISSMRYGLDLFPIFIVLAIWGRRPLFHKAYLFTAGITGLKLAWLFAVGTWVA